MVRCEELLENVEGRPRFHKSPKWNQPTKKLFSFCTQVVIAVGQWSQWPLAYSSTLKKQPLTQLSFGCCTHAEAQWSKWSQWWQWSGKVRSAYQIASGPWPREQGKDESCKVVAELRDLKGVQSHSLQVEAGFTLNHVLHDVLTSKILTADVSSVAIFCKFSSFRFWSDLFKCWFRQV